MYSLLLGNPVEHSVSPKLFKLLHFFAKQSILYEHKKELITSDTNLKDRIINMKKNKEFIGSNVTLPYKLKVIDYVDEVSQDIEYIKAINTIYKSKDKLIGCNTDWIGIKKSLEMFSHLKNPRVLILGTGGASRAAIYATKNMDAENITVLYRDKPELSSNTKSLIDSHLNKYIRLDEYSEFFNHLKGSDVVINCTSYGMKNIRGKFPVPVNLINEYNFYNTTFLDCVFNPVRTDLINNFSKKGANVIDGIWMMIFQGIEAYSLWTNQRPNISLKDLNSIHQELVKEVTISNEYYN